MRVLLDEMLPRTLAQHLTGAETVRDRGWSGLKNSALLREAETAGFSILLTADRSLRHQQNVAGLRIGVLVLPTSKLDPEAFERERVNRVLAHYATRPPAGRRAPAARRRSR